jgi:hypothetical protein
VFADARTPNLAGPGVDVFVRTPFPRPGDRIQLDVEARGGDLAALTSIDVFDGTEPLATFADTGPTWAGSIQRSRRRGSDVEAIRFPVPAHEQPGDTLHLELRVAYVVAMSSDGVYRNVENTAVIPLELEIHSAASRKRAQLSRVGLALGCFGFWFFLVWGVTKLCAKVGGGDGRHDSALEAIGLLMGFVGGAVLGYWLFAWRIMNAVEERSALVALVLMIVWCAAPLAFAWRWWTQRKNRPGLPAARVIAR